MTTYHQLLNQLDHLKLDRVRQLLPEFLDEHADISLVDGLHELLSEEDANEKRSFKLDD